VYVLKIKNPKQSFLFAHRSFTKIIKKLKFIFCLYKVAPR